jgi:hypothetical protein
MGLQKMKGHRKNPASPVLLAELSRTTHTF